MEIQKITKDMEEKVKEFMVENWGSTVMVSRGHLHELHKLPGFIALENGQIKGIVTYAVAGDSCEMVSLDSFSEKKGIGSELVECVVTEAKKQGLQKVWLITTNDNTNAIRFYQKRGFVMTYLYIGAVEEARKLKKEIPQTGYDGIPILHEIQFEKNFF
ncbi:GNAT family N-acetyltransferase [Bacillus manliponensis]|uniref:GNAT family N-acetyltransferase n=1 Tax=Bacillus manliponensis TaxID=574376 RepID=UPI0035151220